MSHTPGPWAMEHEGEDENYVSINSDKGHHYGLARVVWRMEGEKRSPEKEANARLIAAAPDLLEACRNALAAGAPDEVATALLAAVRKAEGRK